MCEVFISNLSLVCRLPWQPVKKPVYKLLIGVNASHQLNSESTQRSTLFTKRGQRDMILFPYMRNCLLHFALSFSILLLITSCIVVLPTGGDRPVFDHL